MLITAHTMKILRFHKNTFLNINLYWTGTKYLFWHKSFKQVASIAQGLLTSERTVCKNKFGKNSKRQIDSSTIDRGGYRI